MGFYFKLFSACLMIIILFGKKVVQFWKAHRHKRRLSKLIPGDEGWPIIGNLWQYRDQAKALSETVPESCCKLREDLNGRILKIWLVNDLAFFPTDGETVKSILESSDEITKGDQYDAFEPWLGRGLIFSSGRKWHGRRKMLLPAFAPSLIDQYIGTINKHAQILQEVLSEKVGQEFDFFPFSKRCALDVICDTAMGESIDAQHTPHQPYVRSIEILMRLGMEVPFKPHLWFSFGRWLSGWQQQYDENIHAAHNLTNRVITNRLEYFHSGDGSEKQLTFLDMLIGAQEKYGLNIDDIREEVDTFMFAGHDTTATALGWIFWCLANHPEYQEQCYEEVTTVLGDKGVPDKSNMAQLVYLERCIKESLRMFPPVPYVTRALLNDLPMGECTIPAGSSLVVSPFLIQRNEKIYPNPNVYDPDRFLPEKVKQRHSHDFVPFAAGPRNCIGQKFAMYEMKIIMVHTLRKYKLRSKRDFLDLTLLTEVILRSAEGINIFLERR